MVVRERVELSNSRSAFLIVIMLHYSRNHHRVIHDPKAGGGHPSFTAGSSGKASFRAVCCEAMGGAGLLYIVIAH